ncbi:SusC/RagA family TonB-linked outer membrane protein [Spirosoma utsteinense]|uniref:TonB-linked SusC/RagA family outer membrane protein n=1 Tax=Spirosoma utsteinense TaxID=2585773 RepID=A0ABR6W3I2_9BACT|nr:TonB-dependent receptor [Spirosoma utsteinense]MBC3788470.1 TonB-linked SusC/RagA family outer membrane protein [Spirosoma utsteinense]MBC3791103.1 TonB-linked SusC/RagA family outer membrane protein [Spirosoma utsteinense]
MHYILLHRSVWVRIMKITSLQLLFAFALVNISFAFDGRAQDLLERRISLSAKNQDVESVFKRIEKQANVQFLFSREIIQSKRKVTYQATNEQLSLLLEHILAPLSLKYEVVGQQILIKREAVPVTLPQQNSTTQRSNEAAQDVQLTGQVTGDNGEGLPGVNIQIKSTNRGTTTDVNGNYKLTVPEGSGTTLVFSFIGYGTKEVAVGNQSAINVTLIADNKTLNEVVVVGYGTQRKTSLTGAIASVSDKEIGVLPVSNISQSLQGRAAGVTVTNNGAPGEAPIIRIRGVGTVNNANPLYVVDGVPVGDGSNVDPKDVQSIEVLKDASAAAIYGSRAANGVILITTKRSNSKKLSVTIDSYVGVQTAWRKLPLLNRDQYIAYGTDLLNNGDIYNGKPAGTSIPPRWQTGLDQPIYTGATQTFRQTDTDWQDEMFRNATIQQHRLELSGGNDVSKFYLSGGFFSQDGIMLGTDYKRGNIRLNSDHKLGKRVTLGQTLYLAYDSRRIEQNGGSIGTQIRNIINTIPYLPVYNPNNLGGFEGSKNVDGTDPSNPVRNVLLNSNTTQSNTVFSTFYVDVEILTGLKYRFQGGINIYNSIGRTVNPSYDSGPGGFASLSYASISQDRGQSVAPIYTNQLSYIKDFGKHTINATAVAEKQTSVFSNINLGGNNTITNAIIEPTNLTSPRIGAGRAESAILSYVGRLNYEYSGKYLLGLSFRRDGSSKYAPGKKWGNFPAASAGWRISEERFMKNIPAITELKLRGSYGLVGNNNIGDYGYQATLSSDPYYEFDKTTSIESQGYTIRKLANRDLKWESVAMTNVGIDATLLNGKFSVSVDYFNNLTRDMVLNRPIPPSMGYDEAPLANVGSVQNRGIELQAGYQSNKGALTWQLNGNISAVRNKVISLGDVGNTIFGGDWYGDNITKTEVGQPIGYFYGYKTNGIFQNQGEVDSWKAQYTDVVADKNSPLPGDIRYTDVNGDGKVDPSDKVKIGQFLPKFTYGTNFTAKWKGVDLTLFIQGVQGNQIYSTVKYNLEGMTRLFNAGTAVLDRWVREGQVTDVPRAVAGDPNHNARASNRFVESGSYIRMKNLTVGYALPANWLAPLGTSFITRARVYVSTTNLLTITGYKSGYDPEIGSFGGSSLTNGIDYGQFPQARTIMAGLQIGF